MARFLFMLWPEHGHMYPSLPIAQALRASGHEVAYLTLPEFHHLLVPHGITFFPLTEHTATPATELARRQPQGEDDGPRILADAFRRKFVAPVPTHVQTLQKVIAAWRPDVLVNDPLSYAPLLVAELEDLPVATLNHNVFSWPGVDFGPFGLGLPPAHDATTRAHYAALRARADAAFAGVVIALNAVRASFGLPPRPGPLPVATLSPYLQLLPTIPALDYERADLPPQVHYVGPCLWDPPAPPDQHTAEWLAEIPANMPLALVTESTAQAWRPGKAVLAEAALAGLHEAGVAVLATAPFEHPLHSSPMPPYARMARFVSHTYVLPRATVVVTHGGHGIATKALRHGLPLVVAPYASEQPEVAQRVVAAGAGLRLERATLTPAGLCDAVRAVLDDGRYRARAQHLAAALARHEGPAEAAALLARLAAARQPMLRETSNASVSHREAVRT